MKALAIDTSISKITISAKNEEKTATEILDIGMKQSESLLPAVSDVMDKVYLQTSDLDFLSVSEGPGSFTGLRLGYACIKALEMVSEKPLFAYSTLDVYAEPFMNLPFVVLSGIDAHKGKFYFKAFEDGKEVFPEGDYTIEKISGFIKSHRTEKDFISIGPVSETLKKLICENESTKEIFRPEKNPENAKKIYSVPFSYNAADSLFTLAEKDFISGKKGIEDYSGPVYLRLSEAEENLRK